MRYYLITIILLTAGALQAQLPIRNYIFLNQDTIVRLLEEEGLEFEVYDADGYDDSYGYDYDYEDEEVYYEEDSANIEAYGEEEDSVQDEELAITQPVPAVEDTSVAVVEEEMEEPMVNEVDISVFSSEAFGYTGNDASFFLRNDSCYLVQYNWYNDPFVLETVRQVMDQREDFSPCFDMKDCWVQQKPGDDTVYYWNLFEKYEEDENWKVLRIEADEEFEENRWWYQFAEGKY